MAIAAAVFFTDTSGVFSRDLQGASFLMDWSATQAHLGGNISLSHHFCKIPHLSNIPHLSKIPHFICYFLFLFFRFL